MKVHTHLFVLAIFALTGAVFGQPAAVAHAGSASNASCLRCHALPTLSVRDSVLGGIRNMSVNPDAFAHSNHGKLQCVQCHEQGYFRWPHSADQSAVAELSCATCHTKPERELKPLFAGIQKEYSESIHAKRLGDKFSCFSCHDPHAFKRHTEVTKSKIESSNAVCLNCHASEERFSSLTTREFPVLEITHAWLPNQAVHWRTVRCVDCHTSYDAPNLSHKILPKEQAVTKCESCHSENSILLAKLYKYQHREAQQRMGFVNGVLLNDAYVIGSTRNPLLDILSIVVFGLTIVSATGHGLFRYFAKKKRVRKEKTKGEDIE